MSSIGEHVSNIRNLIKQVQDDSVYTDSYLYSLFDKASSRLMRMRAESYQNFSRRRFTTFCLELEDGFTHDCECINYGCTAKKSVHPIPGVYSGRGRDMYKVLDLSGNVIPYREERQVRDDQINPVRRGKPSHFIRNSKIYLINADYKVVQVEGLWENPFDWENIQYCSDDTNDCVDIYSLEHPIETDMEFQAYELVLNLMRIPLSIPDDVTQDQNPNIKM